MRVLAIDPGGTTGMAAYTPGDFGFESWEIPGGLEGFAQWWLRGRQPGVVDSYDFVVIEKFTIMASTLKKTRQYDALEIIGLVKATSHVSGPPCLLQTPAQAKSFATDDKLKALKWFDSSPGGHKNDATRHLVTCLAAREPGFLDRLAEVLGL